ncbi:putative excinuclease ABC, C subunit, N-terminal [Rickettsia rhipicephali str. Ect]|uniref:Excinuclease ABC subunit C n=2 Tax=spotted fever group TaxID=114277 RepID=H6QJM5_RICMA|nr:excinuclease ABC subunit C [Rickettsia massiliae str. AZT80]KJV78868.1 putative excinuclease ABC, C subunit, N-terminal [Rickettsia rhipicephali str. Ect]
MTDIQEALTREKNLKKWQRSWQIELIENTNPEWEDLIE